MSSGLSAMAFGIMTGVVALAFLEILQLLGDVVGAEAGEARPFGIRAVAVRAMACLADDRFGGARFRVAGRPGPRLLAIAPEIVAARIQSRFMIAC
jgi:hypothetical protein